MQQTEDIKPDLGGGGTNKEVRGICADHCHSVDQMRFQAAAAAAAAMMTIVANGGDVRWMDLVWMVDDAYSPLLTNVFFFWASFVASPIVESSAAIGPFSMDGIIFELARGK